LFGLGGKGVALAGLQQALSVAAGVFMLGMAFFAGRFERFMAALPGFGTWTEAVKQQMGRLLRQHSGRAYFSMGMLNGLLPCGMVYVALAGSVATTAGLEGGLFMAAFGAGTLPLLFVASALGHTFRGAVRQKIRVVQPALLILAGCLLLQRGLHVDLSLFETAVPKAGLECH
ncbi:MAG: sulfite exporter TauE/SafE family protein, partial [Saprospiraceae bacterium]